MTEVAVHRLFRFTLLRHGKNSFRAGCDVQRGQAPRARGLVPASAGPAPAMFQLPKRSKEGVSSYLLRRMSLFLAHRE